MRRVLFAISAVALALSGCSDRLFPPEFEVLLHVAPTAVVVGDTVHFMGTAYNGTDGTIEAGGRGCGPGIGFAVVDSLGEDVELFSGPWTCEVKDSNILDPGEVDEVGWDWVPAEAGVYRVHAYVIVQSVPTTVESTRVEVRVEE